MFNSRKEAIAAGVSYYFTGKPCKHGHVCNRHIKMGCIECAKIAQKNYRDYNNEKWKDKNARWREANRQKIADKDAEYRVINSERRRALRLKYKVAKRARTPKFYESEFDAMVLGEAIDLARRRTHDTGFNWEVDHMLPLRGKNVSGLHCAHNIQVIPATLNRKKGNKLIYTKPLDWLKAIKAP
ncbi:hypothetical protein ACOB6L_004606 [Salmonella enterica subsp. enterica serovar Typhimurium]